MFRVYFSEDVDPAVGARILRDVANWVEKHGYTGGILTLTDDDCNKVGEAYAMDEDCGDPNDIESGFPYDVTDLSDDGDALASCGMGDDENYGCFDE